MFKFTAISHNKKTGPIPVTTTAKQSCPETCPLKGSGCYAETGPVNRVWIQLCNESEDEFLGKVKKIKAKQLWRHNQAGDLLHKDGVIDREFLKKLTKANGKSRGFTYTHHLPTPHNLDCIREANGDGFTINLSANSPEEAVEYAKTGLPVVTVVGSEQKKNFKLDGKQFIICPATKHDTTCADCQLCQKANRNCIVAFPAHGMRKKKVDEMLGA